MKFSNFATISLFLVASCSETLAYGPKTLSAKKQDRFFKCLLAMQGSDENKDARLSLDEYDTMVHNLGILLFDSPKEHLETSFYQDAVKASNPPAGTSQIDIYGADASNVSFVITLGLEHSVWQSNSLISSMTSLRLPILSSHIRFCCTNFCYVTVDLRSFSLWIKTALKHFKKFACSPWKVRSETELHTDERQKCCLKEYWMVWFLLLLCFLLLTKHIPLLQFSELTHHGHETDPVSTTTHISYTRRQTRWLKLSST